MNRWFLLALRIVIGWHFLYEGVWKIQSDRGVAPYVTTRDILQRTTARLRDDVMQAAEPLDLPRAIARADAWYDDIEKSFKAQRSLAEDQKARLAELRDQVKINLAACARGELARPDVAPFDWTYVHEIVLRIPPPPPEERFSSLAYLQGSAGPLRGVFRGLVVDLDGLGRLSVEGAKRGIDAQYEALLRHYAHAGKPFNAAQSARLAAQRDHLKSAIEGTLNAPDFRARLADYRPLLARVAGDAKAREDMPFVAERLDADRKKLDTMAAEMLEVVNEPLAELAIQARAIATIDQLSAGPAPRPPDPAAWIDRTLQWSLTVIGLCLVLGLFTPWAALAAAGQLIVFYLASPPWPGLPAASLGGHYLYIDRNLIEAVAALVVATGATKWAALDGWLKEKLARRRQRAAPQPEETPVLV
jgi:uncharacterized membrane protein YphA (DoxX/SURF4 family)